MKTNPLAVVSARNLALALLVSLASLPAGAAVFDDFESYAVGSNLHGQGGWSGWAGDSGAGALVSTSFSFSPTRSVNVTGATDLVHTFSGVTNGQWVFKVMQYIPSTSSGTNYVILLNRYQPPFTVTDLNWSVQIQNNLNTGQIISDLGAGASRPMVKNQWVEIRVEINLASNTVSEFYNGQLLSTHVWQDGSGLNELQALDLFANDSGPVYYDNVSLAPAPAPGTSLRLSITAPSSFNESNRQAVLEWNAEPGKTYLVQSTDDLSSGTGWKTEEPVTATKVGPVRWTAPEVIRDWRYYRLILPQPEVYSVEPAFIDSSDPTSLLYIFGQCIPTNGTIVINGQNYTPTLVDSNGGWAAISLNGLPPGTPVIGSILVLDSGSNIVATLPLQTPVVYGTEMTTELIEGPPDEPPASPSKKEFKGHVTLLKRTDSGSGMSAGKHTKTGHVTLLKRGGDDSSNAGKKEFKGHVTLLKRGDSGSGLAAGKHTKTGHVTLLKRGGDDSSAGKKEFKGHVTLLKRTDSGSGLASGKHTKTGHVTLLKRGMDAGRAAADEEECDDGDCDDYDEQTVGTGPNGQGLRISGGTGEVLLDEVDLIIPGRGLDFIWARTYRSRTGPNTPQGAGWDFSYNVSLAPQPDGTIVLHPGNGRADTFYPNGTNGWARDEYFCEVRDLNSDGMPDVVFADTGRWLFNPLGTAAGGKLWQIIDRTGNTMTFEYDLKGLLTTIVDDLGRTNTVAYNLSGQIVSITDSDGRILRYEYDGNGDLTACISPVVTGTPNGNDFPGGKTNRYAYTSGQVDDRLNHNLVSCTDGNGQTWVTIVYQPTNNPASLNFDAAASISRGTDKTDLWRGMVISKPGYVTRVLQAVINDGVGNVTECFYDSRFRPVEVREFTGRANADLPTTATQNRPVGKLRDTDPDHFETRFEWNADSLCTRIIYPRGNSEEIVYERAFNQNDSRSNRRHAGNLRIAREIACCGLDDDGDGIVDTLTTTFAYDPRFGSPATVCGKKLYVGNLPYSRSGIPIGNGVAINTKGTGADKNRFASGPRQTVSLDAEAAVGDKFAQVRGFKVDFAVSATDARGVVATSEYDTNGNCTKVDKRTYTGGRFILELDGAASYNSHGQLTAVTNAADANGFRRVDTFSYYSSGPSTGYLQSDTCDATGLALTTSYEYDTRANLTRVVDARGFATTFTYNALDQLVHAESQPDVVYPFITWDVDLRYDANDNLVQCDDGNRDSSGVLNPTNATITTLCEYDAFDRVTRVADETNPGSYRTNEFVYNANDHLVLHRSGEAVSGNDPNAVVQYMYDERDLIFQCVAAPGTGLGATNQWDYDENANGRVSKVDAFTIKQMTYDGFDRCIQTRDAYGNTASFAYDRNGNLVYERLDAELNDVPGSAGNLRYHEWRWRHDALDRCVESSGTFFDPVTQLPIGDGSSVTTFSYAPNGQCLTSTDDNGHITLCTYDTVGRLSSVMDPKTNLVSFSYDQCDNVLSVTQTDRSDLTPGAQQFTVVSGYDKLHRLLRSVDSVGNTNLYAYDSRDNLVWQRDPRGNEATYGHDGQYQLTITRNYAGPVSSGITISTTHLEYDSNSRCVATTDSNTNITHYAYDSLDRRVSTTEADGTVCSLIWSPRSNLLREQDANSTVISNSFDLLDRCIRRDVIPGSGVAATTTFETFAYDGLSRLVAATNDVSISTFAYDSFGNCVRGVSGGLGAVVSTFDGVGNRLSMTYPSGRVTTYTYDALDQVTSVGSSTGGLPATTLVTYEYEGPGRLGRITRANNVNTRLQWNGLVNPPNAAEDFGVGQVKGINHQVAGGGAVIDRRVFSYDQNQNKNLRAQASPFFLGGDMTTNLFQYDALDRLSRAINTKGNGSNFRMYVMDGNGNRQMVVSNGLAEPYMMDATIPPGDFQMNQYTTTPVSGQSYDENGNLIVSATAIGPTFFHYDYADRLVEVVALTGGGALEPVASFSYDALGRRISKTSYPPALPPLTTQFVHDTADEDCDGIIEEHENGTPRRTHVFPHVLETSGRVMFTSTGETFYFHCDDLANTLALTDASGNVVERYDYDDFGAPRFLSTDGFPIPGATASSVGNPYLFRGMEWDSETGFYHGSDGASAAGYKATQGKSGKAAQAKRYSDPNTGRSITRGESGSIPMSDNNPWSQRSGINGINGGMPNRISMNVTVPKQTQGATFGEKVNAGLHAAGGGGGGSKAQDHNSSRSNKTSSLAGPGGGGGGGGGGVGASTKQLLYTAKAGKTGSASGK